MLLDLEIRLTDVLKFGVFEHRVQKRTDTEFTIVNFALKYNTRFMLCNQ